MNGMDRLAEMLGAAEALKSGMFDPFQLTMGYMFAMGHALDMPELSGMTPDQRLAAAAISALHGLYELHYLNRDEMAELKAAFEAGVARG